MPTCVVLTTDTTHHRYFLNRLARRCSVEAVFEQRHPDRWRLYRQWVGRRRTPWSLVENPYLVGSWKRFERRQEAFERDAFARHGSLDIDGVDVRTFDDVNDPGCVDFVRARRPELTISFGTGLIGAELLALPGLKVNVHRGILPTYRGLDSDLWAAYFRDFGGIGTTIHQLDTRFDTGRVVGLRRLLLTPGMRAHHLRYHTTLLASEIVEEILDRLEAAETVEGAEQPAGAGGYYSYIPPVKRQLAIGRFERHVRSLPG